MIKIHFPYQLVDQTIKKLNTIDNKYLSKKVVEYIFIYSKVRFFIQKIDFFFQQKKIKKYFLKIFLIELKF